ncbi:MAG: hypothetical protein JXQ29_15645 [Planctomycetes bacterium]|nr:hypothetical protein [Planctomycetota bacterium]
MRRIALLVVAVGLVGLVAASVQAQQSTWTFTTELSTDKIQPGNTLGIKAVLDAANTLPPLASRECYFLMGLDYNPRRFAFPFVVPPMILGKAQFQAVRTPVGVKIAAGMRLPIPQMRLPANYRLPLWFQGVALVQTRTSGVQPLPARPAMVMLVP